MIMHVVVLKNFRVLKPHCHLKLQTNLLLSLLLLSLLLLLLMSHFIDWKAELTVPDSQAERRQ
jgi:hypothetical protein